jgi:two-component system sensor histidine kinase MprB
MSLRSRIVTLVVVATLLTAATVGLAAGLIVNRTLQSQIDRALTLRIEGLLGRPLFVSEGLAIAPLAPGVVSNELQVSAGADELTDDEGPRILLDFYVNGVHLPKEGVTESVKTDLEDMGDAQFLDPVFQTVNTDEGPVRVAIARLNNEQHVRAMRSLVDIRQLASRFGFTLAAWGVAIAVVAALVTSLIVGRALNPLRRLTAAARRVSQTQDLRDTGLRDTAAARQDEIGELAQSMAEMSDALAQSRDQQRQLVDDVAHEMRTPLTSIRTNIELLSRATVGANAGVVAGAGSAADTGTTAGMNATAGTFDAQETLADVASEVAELDALITEVAELATPEDLGPELEETVPVQPLIEELVARAVRRSVREITLHIADDARGLEVIAVPKGLERAINNIIGNAIKFAPNGPIEVALRRDGVYVSDAGDGIPEAERPRVQQRFWRSPKARALPGSGLGLAIAAKVAKQLNGELVMNVSKFGGAEVGVVWSAQRVIGTSIGS